MNLYWKSAAGVAGEDPRGWTQKGPPHALDEMDAAGQHHTEGESSTAAMGREAYEAVTGEEPSDEAKSEISYTVHWSYGTAAGALYGVLRGARADADLSGGLAFGTALWLLGDELMVPLLGLSKGATAYPPAQHAHRLGAHLAYGLAAAATVQAGQAFLEKQEAPTTWRERLWKTGKTYFKWKVGKKVVGAAVNKLRST